MIIDIHSHRKAPYPKGIISIDLADNRDFLPENGQFYSVGVHPWATDTSMDLLLPKLKELALLPGVVAIGEAGIDLSQGGLLYEQMLNFRAQAELAEEMGKPLIVHCVKGQAEIIGLHKEMQPQQQWIVHGFRGKPSVAMMFAREGIAMSFGEKFNPEALCALPEGLVFAETDESPLPIEDILSSIENVRPGATGCIEENMHRLFNV